MTTAESIAPTIRHPWLRIAAVVAIGLALVTSLGVLLHQYGPGRMWLGYTVGASAMLLVAAVAGWRVARRPDRTTTAERAFLGAGDERDGTVATHAFAALGALSVPATAIAAVALAVGAPTSVVTALLLWGELAVLVVAFAVINRRR